MATYSAIYDTGKYDESYYDTPLAVITSDSYVKKLDTTKTINSDSYIQKAGNSNTLDSDAYILEATSKTIDSDAFIKQLAIAKTLSSDAYIKTLGSEGSITSNMQIGWQGIGSIDSNAIIKSPGNISTIDSDAWIKKVYPKILDSDYYIKKLDITKTLTSDAFITIPASGSISSDAEINWIGKPTLIYPPNGDTITDDPPLFRWYIPVSKFNVHCRIQVSRNAAFTDIELDESDFNAVAGTWEYYTGGSWVAYPAEGVLVTQVDTIMARVSFPGITGVKYWRVKGVVR